MTTRKDLIEALRLRYRSAALSDRIKILDEFVALTCYCVFRRSVTDRFGIVTAEFGSVTDHFGDVTDGRLVPA